MNFTNNQEFRVLLVGQLVPEYLEPVILNQAIPAMQTQRFGGALLDSLMSGFNGNVDVFSVAPLLDYPLCPILISPSAFWSPRKGVNAHLASYLNVLGLKHLTRFVATLMFVTKWTIRNRSANRLIMMHGAQSAQLGGVLLGSIVSGTKFVSFLTDDLGLSQSWEGWLHKLLRRLDIFLLRSGLRRISLLIAMTRDLADKWAPGKSVLVVPAILPDNASDVATNHEDDGLFNIVYSGGLQEHFGVRLLLEAFRSSAFSHWRLTITGKGALEKEIRNQQDSDSRIIFKGLVPFSELKDVYASASVFVNPRSSHDELTRFLFPSKLVEQMATGRPVVSTILPCLTEEFREHLVLVSPETPLRLFEVLVEIDRMGRQKRNSFGLDARDFVIQKFTPAAVGLTIKNQVTKQLSNTGPV